MYRVTSVSCFWTFNYHVKSFWNGGLPRPQTCAFVSLHSKHFFVFLLFPFMLSTFSILTFLEKKMLITVDENRWWRERQRKIFISSDKFLLYNSPLKILGALDPNWLSYTPTKFWARGYPHAPVCWSSSIPLYYPFSSERPNQILTEFRQNYQPVPKI